MQYIWKEERRRAIIGERSTSIQPQEQRGKSSRPGYPSGFPDLQRKCDGSNIFRIHQLRMLQATLQKVLNRGSSTTFGLSIWLQQHQLLSFPSNYTMIWKLSLLQIILPPELLLPWRFGFRPT